MQITFSAYTAHEMELTAEFMATIAKLRREMEQAPNIAFEAELVPAHAVQPPAQAAEPANVVEMPKRKAKKEPVNPQITDSVTQIGPEKAAEPANEEPAKTYTKDDLRRLLVALSTAKGADRVRKLFDKFGAPNVSGLSEDKYAEFVAAVEAEMA